MLHHPPKNINDFAGYRTSMSRKNRDTWKFAHEYCGRLWQKAGAVLLMLSAAVQLPLLHANEDTISLASLILEGVQLAVLLGTVFFVEKALKNTFDASGRRKQ